MRVVHVSTDDVTGGAARCAARLHQGLRALPGTESSMLVDRKRGDLDGVVAFRARDSLWARRRIKRKRRRIRAAVERYASTRPPGYEPFNPDESPYGRAPLDQIPPCDVVNLHWVARFIDTEGLAAWLPEGLPVVWTLHDMHVLTGGCHYNDGCRRFESGCGSCPQLGSDDPEDLSARSWVGRQQAFAAMPPGSVEIVTPSRWLAEEVRKSGVIPPTFGVRTIPYGLDTDLFAPSDRTAWRQRLDVPGDAQVVLFVAQSVETRRKGFALLARALPLLADLENLCLVSVGKGEPTLEGGIPSRHLGEIRSDEEMAGIYGMADVFCVPSLQDNLPATVLEALACGTPVAGLPVGGIPDMVRTGVTGELARDCTAEALAASVRTVLSAPREPLSDRCRRTALDEYPLRLQASRYVDLYRELLARRAPHPEATVSAS